MKVIILFFIVFTWRVPYVYNTAFLSMILVSVIYIFDKDRIPFTYFYQRYNVVILVGTVVIALVIFIISMIHSVEVMNNIQKRMWVELVMLWAVVYALPFFIGDNKSNAFNEMSMIVCCAFALQGMIHLAGFLYSPLGDILFEMKPPGIKQKVLSSRYNVARFRLYCLSGSVFVELVAAYGVAFILFFRLLLLNSLHSFFYGWRKYVILLFMTMGTMLAGRTGFVGLALGLILWFLFSFNRIFVFVKQNSFYIVSIAIVLVLAFNFIVPSDKRKMFVDEVIPFAFEFYYHYRDYGTFGIASLDGTESHYFPLRDETLLKGHGSWTEKNNYPHSDAGYINNLIFGGIPYLFCLIIYQSLYFIRPISAAGARRSFSNRVDVALFMLLFFYIFVISYKTTAIGTLHTVMSLYIAAGSAYLTQYCEEEEEEEGVQNELIE